MNQGMNPGINDDLSAGLFETAEFEPTLAAARARVAAIRPAAYARSRNHIDGDVSRLSPYLTHGFLTLPEALAGVLQRGPLPIQHKLVYEFGWRAYFHHVWQHRGDGIFESLHEGVLPDSNYRRDLPADIRCGQTGVPAIDQAVRTLYATGYLHNHARMWLASYVVHLRKVHWRAGADWLYGHLLDGDLASNHLSWQWVAGTGSHKPYLFNAENVARYAPPIWHSPGTVIDTDYETLDRLARSDRAVAGGPYRASRGAEPALLTAPEDTRYSPPDAAAVRGRTVRLVHAWDLGDNLPPVPDELRVGVALSEFHSRWPWGATRWQFVSAALHANCDLLWWGSAADVQAACAAAASVHCVMDPHIDSLLPGLQRLTKPSLLAEQPRLCSSFSKFWTQATRGMTDASELGR